MMGLKMFRKVPKVQILQFWFKNDPFLGNWHVSFYKPIKRMSLHACAVSPSVAVFRNFPQFSGTPFDRKFRPPPCFRIVTEPSKGIAWDVESLLDFTRERYTCNSREHHTFGPHPKPPLPFTTHVCHCICFPALLWRGQHRRQSRLRFEGVRWSNENNNEQSNE